MSKIGQRQKQNVRLKEIRDTRHRQEQEWLLHEQRETRLERWRMILIFVWILLCFIGAYFIGNENAVLVWAGLSGFGMIAAYYLYGLWLERKAGKGSR
ncbi:MAG TPA: hypothetical protein VI457_13035 [Methylococcaceae bacterium]|nr:hypothetical protein [Methylococcaceae bacterium]